MSKAKRNKWEHIDGKIIQSEEHPGENWYPVVSVRRVSGASYTPYATRSGSEAWVRNANRVLASMARSNFERGR